MYLGKVSVTQSANALRTLFNMTSAPKSPPINDPTNLDEVVVTAKRSTPIPFDEPMAEIEVQGTRIQWWQWLLGGAALAGIVTLIGRK